jgi:putative spermidine/putrescine transport system ATP-binding protein
MLDVSLRNLTKIYSTAAAVDGINLEVEKGEFIALLGPSGCGKTTTLRMVAGFIEPTAGEIIVGGRDVTHLAPEKRNMGMVFQSYALFPHMTVRKNVEFGLVCHSVPAAEIPSRIDNVLRMVGLEALHDRYPKQLSGGQQQRVALARVMAIQPSLLLFDEPLSNLDAFLRVQMRSEIRQLQRRMGVTALFVTHDQEEAMTMADRIVVMSKGRIEQIGTPGEVYDHPQTRFVANFIGSANFFEGALESNGSDHAFRTQDGAVFPLSGVPGLAAKCLAIRPERIDLGRPGEGLIEGKVDGSIQLGAMMEYEVALGNDRRIKVQTQRRADMPSIVPGQQVSVSWRPDDVNLLVD